MAAALDDEAETARLVAEFEQSGYVVIPVRCAFPPPNPPAFLACDTLKWGLGRGRSARRSVATCAPRSTPTARLTASVAATRAISRMVTCELGVGPTTSTEARKAAWVGLGLGLGLGS